MNHDRDTGVASVAVQSLHLHTPSAQVRFGIAGNADTFEIVSEGDACARGYFRNADFPGQECRQNRAELFYIDAGLEKQAGIGTALALDALRVVAEMGAQTVVVYPTNDGGKGLIRRLVADGYISGPVQVSETKIEYRIEQETGCKWRS